MRSFAAIILTGLLGYTGAAAASPLAWAGSVAVLLYSYVRSMKHLKQLENDQQFVLDESKIQYNSIQ